MESQLRNRHTSSTASQTTKLRIKLMSKITENNHEAWFLYQVLRVAGRRTYCDRKKNYYTKYSCFKCEKLFLVHVIVLYRKLAFPAYTLGWWIGYISTPKVVIRSFKFCFHFSFHKCDIIAGVSWKSTQHLMWF